MIVQPQAVCVTPSRFQFHEHLTQFINPQKRCPKPNGCYKHESLDMAVFLLVAGLRPVKDPLYLAASIAEWHKEDNHVRLVVVGPELDTEFARDIKCKVQRFPGVNVLPSLQACDLHAAIQSCFAVVNSSTSEGMPSAVLESMALGVPVLARNIPGNSALIKHRETGFLFNTPEEFVSLAKELKESPSLCHYLTRNATKYVNEHHSTEVEKKTYKELLEKLVPH